jgi:hypothetical protein
MGTTTWKRFSRTAVLAAVATLGSAGVGRAEDSNRNDVRANLEKGGWSVIWGKNFTEGDWAEGSKAVAESVAAENPGPFLAWFGRVVDENFAKIERNLPGVAKRDLERWVVQSLKQRQIVRYKGFQIEAGFATYNRWQTVAYDEPRTRKKKVYGPLGTWTWGFEAYTERVEKKVPLPNWHQFYIRYKLVPEGNGGGDGGAVSPAQVQFHYTIRNDSGRTVNFRLPSGRDYTLAPGQTGSYRFTGNPAAAKVLVHTTGRTYTLAEGNHRFWWMTKDNQIGLDVAGR